MSDLKKIQLENPRYDLFDNSIIKYKSKEQYLNSFYNNRKNIISHFKKINQKTIKEITLNIIKNIKEIKELFYIPSTVECKTFSCPCPSPALVEFYGLNYIDLIKKLKLKEKFQYKNFNINNFNKKANKVLIDSREQSPFNFNCQTEIIGLKFGDYATTTDLNNILTVERKSGNDFIGTLSKGYDRFLREVNKAKDNNSNILMVVEQDLNSMLSFNYLPQYKWCKATPEFIFSRLRSILQSYSNFQVLFCKNKDEAQKYTYFILSNPEIFKWDIQHLYETKQLNDNL